MTLTTSASTPNPTSSVAVPLHTAVPTAYKSLSELDRQCDQAAADAGLSRILVELIKLRVSQVNGCAFCLRMHTRDALVAGENTDRLAVLAAWRETTYFTDVERAALEVAEDTASLTHDPCPLAVSFLTRDQIAAVRWLATVMSAFNRVGITSGYPVGPEVSQ